jgi:catechol 2,3-dioxygenase-like lactoylglutathione lyase family enzyme
MSLPFNRINFITLAVDDLDRARAYYEALGWVPGFTGDAVAFYDLPGQKLSLFSREGLARETGRPLEDLGPGGVTLAQNQPSRDAVDAAFAHALASGATEVRAPFATDWGGYSCYVADPDGHLWEFAHNPFDPLDAEGHLA